jgi:hypothetical protein
MKRLKRQLECYRLYRSMGIRTVEQVTLPPSSPHSPFAVLGSQVRDRTQEARVSNESTEVPSVFQLFALR